MELQQAIPLINYALRGIDDDAPLEGTDEYEYWVAILNRKKNELYGDASKSWAFSYDVRSAGTIAAGNSPEFELDDAFIAPSGSDKASGIYVITTDDKRVDLDLVKVQSRGSYQSVYIASGNPQILYFNLPIEAGDSIVGGTLYVSGFYMPDDISETTDKLPFLDPYWAITATAAEVAGNDVTYEDKEANLVAKANSLYSQMDMTNRRGVPGADRRQRTSVKRIRGF